MFNPSVYIASLSDHNQGNLVGDWFEVTGDETELMDSIQSVLRQSSEPNAEEWGFFDYDNMPCLGEYADVSEVCEVAKFILEQGDIARFTLSYTSTVSEAKKMAERYLTTCDSLADYLYEIMSDCIDIPDFLAGYIDYESMARDALINGDYEVIQYDREVMIFHR